ncbi:MAG TPA: right-handed parallel beta-helix repeat-containing protein [Pseudolysinimonas sp.]|nr:right-handed parallel beta-helix repeat-containing protein [Pseudolysinimonas sp.]
MTFHPSLGLAGAALVLSGCAISGSAAATSPTSTASATEVPSCPPASVRVDTTAELKSALSNASPGDVIALDDGTYAGPFKISADGTTDRPIYLCGGPGAVLNGGGIDTSYVLHLNYASDWRVLGFTVRNGGKGVMADGAKRVVIGGLTVTRIGDEGIHLRRYSADSLVIGNDISSTGLRQAKFGEGIYIGSAQSNWCTVTSCKPDRSDRNRIIGNQISATTAESVDVKEGTSDGEISENHFDGSGLIEADSWVDVKGNDWKIVGNVGTQSPQDGFQTHEILDGWGGGNRFVANHAQVDGPGAGFVFEPRLDNILSCDNTASGAAEGLANVDCIQ